ncbi:MAG: anti-sigma factor antagonist [Firmicutes bacterium]|nr:anti-sigma factor antagonist [Bacillota bacterium]
MPVTIDLTGEVLTARLSGELDHHAACSVRQQIDEQIGEHRPTMVILDFRDLTFMDSSGIGLVMGRYKAASAVGAELHVCNTSPQIYKVMRLSGLDRLAVIDKGGCKYEGGK